MTAVPSSLSKISTSQLLMLLLSTLQVLRDRKYVRMEKSRFVPEDRGQLVTAFLTNFFNHYVQYDFTASLEDQLDQVSEGKLQYKELLRNLIDNAIAYTPEHGQVTLRVLVDVFSGTLVLLVEDSGPGIPEAERELVFQPFYRALGTNVDGSGLGLAIVLEIAQQHGATVSIEDAWPAGPADSPGTRIAVRFTRAD